jgi:hypothetical protein
MKDESRVGDMVRLLDAGVSIDADEDPSLSTDFRQTDEDDPMNQPDAQLTPMANQIVTQ